VRKGSTGSCTTSTPGREEIIVLAPSWLGDAVMATPFLLALRRRLPAARIVLVCRDYVSEVFKRSPAIDSIIEYRGRSMRARIAAAREASASGFDACFVLPPSFSAALVACSSRSRRRIGYAGQWRRILLTDALNEAGYRSGHLSAVYLRLLERYSGEAEPGFPLPAVIPPISWRKTAHELAGGDSYFVLAPGATYGSAKVWPHERYVALAGLLLDRMGGTAVIIGRNEEREGAAVLAESIGAGARNLAGTLSPEGLFAVLRSEDHDRERQRARACLGGPRRADRGRVRADERRLDGSARFRGSNRAGGYRLCPLLQAGVSVRFPSMPCADRGRSGLRDGAVSHRYGLGLKESDGS
jgi:heptosyltransferase-2